MLQFLLLIANEEHHDKIEYIYRQFYDQMCKIAYSQLKDARSTSVKEDTEDAVQNAFIKIVKYIDRIDVSVSYYELRNYMFTIVTNEVYNILNKNENTDDIDMHSDEIRDDDFFNQISIREEYDRVVAAISELDDIYKITFTYRYYYDMSIAEIAELMGVTDKAIYKRLYKGKEILIKKLKGEKK